MKRLIPVIAIGTTLLLSSCGSEPTSAAEAPAPASASSAAAFNPLEIEVTPELRMDMEVGEPAWRSVSEDMSVTGRIEADETRVARISAPVTGRLVDLNVTVGQMVQKGDVVATIYSTDLAASQSAFLKALNQYQLSERAVERARQLLDAGVIGSAELQRRESEAQQDSVDRASSRKQLSILGMPEEAIQNLETTRTLDSTTQVVAQVSGQVIDRLVTPGQIVQGAEAICVIADMSNVWLVADVPEQSSQHLRVGEPIQAEIPALPGHTIRGVISFVSPVVDRETRTIRARMDLHNPNYRYKPLMLANITLQASTDRRLTIPSSAVVRDGNDEFIFVQLAPAKFVLRKVTLGSESENRRVVLEGLDANEKIVVEGSFHLNNERIRIAAARGAGV